MQVFPPAGNDADIHLAVLLVTTELVNGRAVESVEIRHIRIKVKAALDFQFEKTLNFV